MLVLEDLSVELGERLILENVNITVFPGSLTFIKGPNGSGKTTLLKTIAGLIASSKGKIIYNETNILKDLQAYYSYVNYIGHELAVKDELSIIDNIYFWANLRGTPELLRAAITYFRLNDIADELCGNLSAGLKKRVALSRLLGCYANIWLLDEPEVNLDEENIKLLRNLIDARVSQGGIVIIATHNIYDYKYSQVLDLTDFIP